MLWAMEIKDGVLRYKTGGVNHRCP